MSGYSTWMLCAALGIADVELAPPPELVATTDPPAAGYVLETGVILRYGGWHRVPATLPSDPFGLAARVTSPAGVE